MAEQETFQIAVGKGHVQGTLRRPKAAGEKRPRAVVLICGDPPGAAGGPLMLMDRLAAALVDAGLAVARFGAREGGESKPTAADLVDDASAVFRQLLLEDDLDANRIGLFGGRLGAITAACLAGRTDQINRVGLWSPITSGDVLSRIAKGNAAAGLLDASAVGEAYIESLAKLKPADDLAVHDRPTLLLHGAADRVIPPACARPFLEAADRVGRRLQHELIARADHELTDPDIRSACLARMRRFFTKMKAPAKAVAPA
ncbi:MAG: prolyl oligopeptidase family serine peptidase [Planctomycetota bacterium]|nr:prolyl oligopeptidase family serine peptidase [Planctomycetota bacterium]